MKTQTNNRGRFSLVNAVGTEGRVSWTGSGDGCFIQGHDRGAPRALRTQCRAGAARWPGDRASPGGGLGKGRSWARSGTQRLQASPAGMPEMARQKPGGGSQATDPSVRKAKISSALRGGTEGFRAGRK